MALARERFGPNTTVCSRTSSGRGGATGTGGEARSSGASSGRHDQLGSRISSGHGARSSGESREERKEDAVDGVEEWCYHLPTKVSTEKEGEMEVFEWYCLSVKL